MWHGDAYYFRIYISIQVVFKLLLLEDKREILSQNLGKFSYKDSTSAQCPRNEIV